MQALRRDAQLKFAVLSVRAEKERKREAQRRKARRQKDGRKRSDAGRAARSASEAVGARDLTALGTSVSGGVISSDVCKWPRHFGRLPDASCCRRMLCLPSQHRGVREAIGVPDSLRPVARLRTPSWARATPSMRGEQALFSCPETGPSLLAQTLTGNVTGWRTMGWRTDSLRPLAL